MATRTKKAPNKSAFVRDFLQRDPKANRKAVEEAWLASGHEGVISSALVSHLRSKLGLTRKKRERGAKSRASGTMAEPILERKPRSAGRDKALDEIEGDLDRLIFRLIALGGMETIEDELRKVRRLLYRSYSV
jgi:hypothetical protein